MTIRRYRQEDCEALAELFYKTVHSVCEQDYTARQRWAWAQGREGLKARAAELAGQTTLVAQSDGEIVGFGSIDGTGYLDLLYVRYDFQGRGVATALCDELEKGFSVVETHASVTAKPFFERRGYTVIRPQEVIRCGVALKNFVMKKIKRVK